MAHGPYVMRDKRGSPPTIHRYDSKRGAYWDGAEWVDVDDEDISWSMLGLQRFGIIVDPDEHDYGDLAVRDASDADIEIVRRGGKTYINDLYHKVGDWIVVEKGKFVNRWRDGATTSLESKANEIGLRDHGGDQSSFSPKAIMWGSLASIALSLAAGLLSAYLGLW